MGFINIVLNDKICGFFTDPKIVKKVMNEARLGIDKQVNKLFVICVKKSVTFNERF